MIEALLVGMTSIVCFAIVFAHMRIVKFGFEISSASAAGVSALLDAGLDDDAKERAVQQAGLQLLKLSWQIGWRFALALIAAAAPIIVAAAAGLAPQEKSLGILLRVDFIAIVTVAAIGLYFALPRRRNKALTVQSMSLTSAYGSGDRIMHALAFSGPGVQRILARVDDCLCTRAVDEMRDRPPIFITSLARGGTTALLNALHDMPEIASHRYADMPFMTAPMIWSRFAGKRTDVVERERCHGDGIKIGLHSPEAFDEIFWMLNWPEKYQDTYIDLWQHKDFKVEAQAFLKRQFAKIALLRRPENTMQVRYLSKNNANIARLPLLPKLFPECQIVIPLREPSAHAASLFRQHKNFGRLHQKDAFSKRYMRDIGHFEFGDLHRPLAFNREFLEGHCPEQPDYWLAYWITCFANVAEHVSNLSIIKQGDLRMAPSKAMESLVERLGLSTDPKKQWDNYFRREPDITKDYIFDPALLAHAREVYHELCKQAL